MELALGNCELAFSPIVIDDDGEALSDTGDLGDTVKDTPMSFLEFLFTIS